MQRLSLRPPGHQRPVLLRALLRYGIPSDMPENVPGCPRIDFLGVSKVLSRFVQECTPRILSSYLEALTRFQRAAQLFGVVDLGFGCWLSMLVLG